MVNKINTNNVLTNNK